MQPLLNVSREVEGTCPWGNPFHLIVWKQGCEFYFRSADQLPVLFSFIDKPVISVPN